MCRRSLFIRPNIRIPNKRHKSKQKGIMREEEKVPVGLFNSSTVLTLGQGDDTDLAPARDGTDIFDSVGNVFSV